MINNNTPELDITPLEKFSQAEINLLLLTVSFAADKMNKTIRIPFDHLEELSDYKSSARKLFIKDLEKAFDKLIELNLRLEDESGLCLEKFKMFTGYEIRGIDSKAYVEITGHDKALPLVSSLDQWVLDSLQVFLKLHSGYSKTMFRLLKKHNSSGHIYLSKKDFIAQLNIPPSYKQGDIDRSVLSPIEKELAPLFKNLNIEKVYGSGRGKPVKGYQITFEAVWQKGN